LVETGLAKHGFPPFGCGSSHTPQYAARREVHHLLFKKPPLVRGGWGEVVEGTLAAVAPGTFAPGAVGGRPPGSALRALAPGPWAGTRCPPPRVEGGVTGVGIAEVGAGCEHRQQCASPVVRRSGWKCEEMLTYVSSFGPSINTDKLSVLSLPRPFGASNSPSNTLVKNLPCHH
jgi:hypothetical protein